MRGTRATQADGPAPVSHSRLPALSSPLSNALLTAYVPKAPGCVSGLSETTEFEEARGGRRVPVACTDQFSKQRMEVAGRWKRPAGGEGSLETERGWEEGGRGEPGDKTEGGKRGQRSRPWIANKARNGTFEYGHEFTLFFSFKETVQSSAFLH